MLLRIHQILYTSGLHSLISLGPNQNTHIKTCMKNFLYIQVALDYHNCEISPSVLIHRSVSGLLSYSGSKGVMA